MPTHTLSWNERLRLLRGRMGLNQSELAERLGITREWLSRLESSGKEISEILQIKIARLEIDNSDHRRLNLGGLVNPAVGEESDKYRTVASRIPQQRTPSTRVDCERYVQQLLDNAENSRDPDAFPVILSRLKKQLPLDEWQAIEDTDEK